MMVTSVPQFGNPALQSDTPTTVYESDDLQILCHNPQAQNAVVVFDHRHPRDGNFAVIRPSNKIINAEFSYITVASRRNDWFLSPSLIDCQDQINSYTERYARVVGFGSSMGGYGVLALSRAFRFKQVLIVSPQVTVFPDQPPFDTRFADHAKNLDPTFETLAKSPRKGLGGVIVYDPNVAQDRAHADLITTLFPRLKRVPMSFAGHPALRLVSQANSFHRIQDELISNHISAFRLRQLHKLVRQTSPEYRRALNTYLETRT